MGSNYKFNFCHNKELNLISEHFLSSKIQELYSLCVTIGSSNCLTLPPPSLLQAEPAPPPRGNAVADGGLNRGDCVGDAVGVLGRSEGAGQDEGKCNLDNEMYEILQHSSHLGFDKKDIDFTSYSNQGMVSQKKMVGSLTKGLMLTAIFH